MAAMCPECGADWSSGVTCEDDFHQFGYWELADLEHLGSVHHLMVLSYHLQHPSLYSPEALAFAQQQLIDFLEGGVTPQQMRRDMRDVVDSGKRTVQDQRHGGAAWQLCAAGRVDDARRRRGRGRKRSLRRQRRSVGALDPRIAAGVGNLPLSKCAGEMVLRKLS